MAQWLALPDWLLRVGSSTPSVDTVVIEIGTFCKRPHVMPHASRVRVWDALLVRWSRRPPDPPLRVGSSTPTVDAVCKDMMALSINRSCGLAPCLITVERVVSSSLPDQISLYWLAASVTGGDTSVTQTL